jgi:hypothetical protein
MVNSAFYEIVLDWAVQLPAFRRLTTMDRDDVEAGPMMDDLMARVQTAFLPDAAAAVSHLADYPELLGERATLYWDIDAYPPQLGELLRDTLLHRVEMALWMRIPRSHPEPAPF